MALVILSVGLLIFFGHILASFFERTKVPDVLILMLAGIVIGPMFDIVQPGDFGKVGSVFAALALIIILFEGGIHLNVKHLGAAATDTLLISLSTFIVTVLLIALVSEQILRLDFQTSLLVGTILGGTSAAVVIPLIRALRTAPRPSTVLFLESALTDVLVIVLSLGLLQYLRSGGTAQGGPLLWQIAQSFVMAGLIGAVGAFFWSAILDRIRRFPNTVFTTFAYVFILFGIAELLGYSGAIAALTFGAAVANLPNIPDRVFGRIFSFRLVTFADHERSVFSEAVFLVKTFFFVYLGVSMSFANLRAVVAGLVLALVAFVARAPLIRLLAPNTVSRRDAALMSVLVPKGLASAVLASLLLTAGLAAAPIIQGTVYSAIFFSILLCALLVFLVEHGLLEATLPRRWFGKFAERSEPSTEDSEAGGLTIEPVLRLELGGGLVEPAAVTTLDGPVPGLEGSVDSPPGAGASAEDPAPAPDESRRKRDTMPRMSVADDATMRRSDPRDTPSG